ncbi:PTS fructose transporter subunit IIB [Halarchaeum sp. P4]|uniref:PTS fructose transporter subunit IIB n=1 Tax=Halarchaeum sp. P4 TaxID=3421639 RepID=UPI003EBFB911
MKLVAVTSCPTGIAHSQMAAENLETTGEEMGHDIKVEVQGAMGAENELSAEDIAEADAVIITADTAVQTDRFEGKPIVQAPVKAGVNRAGEMIERAIEAAEAGKSGVISAGGEDAEEGDEEADADAEAESASSEEPTKRGGDPEKGIFRRLRRWLFS